MSYASDSTPTAEERLVTQVIAMKGENLSPTQAQQKLVDAYTAYDQEAPVDGRVERIETALTDLKLVSPSQLSSIDAQLETSVGNSQQTFVNKVVALSENLQGAEFSGCSLQNQLAIYGGLAVATGGFIALAARGDSTRGGAVWGNINPDVNVPHDLAEEAVGGYVALGGAALIVTAIFVKAYGLGC
jgi:hypothetical protein